MPGDQPAWCPTLEYFPTSPLIKVEAGNTLFLCPMYHPNYYASWTVGNPVWKPNFTTHFLGVCLVPALSVESFGQQIKLWWQKVCQRITSVNDKRGRIRIVQEKAPYCEAYLTVWTHSMRNLRVKITHERNPALGRNVQAPGTLSCLVILWRLPRRNMTSAQKLSWSLKCHQLAALS